MSNNDQNHNHRTASCICGAIQLDITGTPVAAYLCHCSACQKTTGVIFASNVAYKAEQVQMKFPKGDDPSSILRTFEDAQSSDSGAVILRSFCARCGCRVTGQRQGSADRVVVIGMGLLDRGGAGTGAEDDDGSDSRDLRADLQPTSEFFCVNRAAWLGEIVGEGGATATATTTRLQRMA